MSRMAETLRDGVQVLASSHADWIKSISSTRGFFRNVGQPIPPVEVKQLKVTTGDEDDEDDDDVAGDAGGDGDGDGDGGGGHLRGRHIGPSSSCRSSTRSSRR